MRLPAARREGGDPMKRRLVSVFLGALLALSAVSSVFASQPPGQTGYEGQPGNQNAQGGYEGQPGNQGG
jgi:hypothetical protein